MLQSLTECPEPVRADERCTWGAEFGEICLSSDALIPFRDNIDRASRTNIRYIAQTGQSNRDSDVTQAANEYGMVMVHTGIRCFLHYFSIWPGHSEFRRAIFLHRLAKQFNSHRSLSVHWIRIQAICPILIRTGKSLAADTGRRHRLFPANLACPGCESGA